VPAKSCTSIWSLVSMVFPCSSSAGADLDAFVIFASFFAAAGFFVVDALRVEVLAAEAFAAGAFAAVVVLGACVFAAEDFGAAALPDVAALDTELFNAVAAVAWAAFAAGLVVASSSAFLARPRRAGALRTLALRGDSGGVPFACARCARVRTMVCIELGLKMMDARRDVEEKEGEVGLVLLEHQNKTSSLPSNTDLPSSPADDNSRRSIK
jgi:hypothetical protein